MEKEARKASDVLLVLESKLDNIIHLYRTQDLNIKILSNKLTLLLDKMSASENTKFSISSDNATIQNIIAPLPKSVKVNNLNSLSVEQSPTGFRRTSRPETFEDQEVSESQSKFTDYNPNHPIKNDSVRSAASAVTQRVVDKNGKAIFLAEVEIVNMSDNVSFKTRTSGAGKWMAQLQPGNYKVFIRKLESLTKEKMEAIQTIYVDGSEPLTTLDALIVK